MKATALLLSLALLAAAAAPAVKWAADSERRRQAAPQAGRVAPAPAAPQAQPPAPPPPATPPPPQPGPPVQQWWVYRGGFGGRPGVWALLDATGKQQIDPKPPFWVGPFPDFAGAEAAYAGGIMQSQGGSYGP